jgi:hypothetical protein
MKRTAIGKSSRVQPRIKRIGNRRRPQLRPVAAHRQRGGGGKLTEAFTAPEVWYEPAGREEIAFHVQPAGRGYFHPVTVAEVKGRLEELPERFTRGIEVVQFSRMTRKRSLFPCYGMQWGPNIYLYPMEETLVETYVRPPLPQQLIESRMYGGKWSQEGSVWRLTWTPETIRDFYLNNVLIHEVGHVNDDRNTSFTARERFADWFAIEYGYRRATGRR